MVTTLAEGMRDRSPRPRLRFSTKDGPTRAVVVRLPPIPTLDVEAIVQSELAAARSVRPPVTNPKAMPSDASGEPRGVLETINRQQRLLQNVLGSGVGDRYLPVTEEHFRRFQRELDKYEAEIRAFVDDWLGYLRQRRLAIRFLGQIDNDGGAPAEQARIKLLFPDPCHETDWPQRPTLPVRPKFKRRLNPLHPDNRFSSVGLAPFHSLLHSPEIAPINLRRDHSGPTYRSGSLEVTYEYASLPHHDVVELDTFVVGMPEAGIYQVRWTIGAKNLVHLEEGTLDVEIIHEETALTPVTTLGNLVRARDGSA
jgi:hypothetical protein